MRLLLISDIHANPWALRAVEKHAGPADAIFCAGDLVNYGPDPHSVLQWIREKRVVAVRGNHDQAVAYCQDPKASPLKQDLAVAMRDWTRDQLGTEELVQLIQQPRRFHLRMGDTEFAMVHGTLLDPLYDYRLTPHASGEFLDEILSGVEADVLVVGHTHIPFRLKHGDTLIVNPGSVGQPLDGDRRASYAIWDDGRITLSRVEYGQEQLLESISTKVTIRQNLKRSLWNLFEFARL